MEIEDIQELMRDAESCARLSQWEEEFCDSIRSKLLAYGESAEFSDKQLAVLNRIQEKVYA